MKLNTDFLTHITKGEHYMISTAKAKFCGIVKSNDTAAYIIECLKTDTTEEEIVNKLLEDYQVSSIDIVRHDVANTIDKLRSLGAIVE